MQRRLYPHRRAGGAARLGVAAPGVAGPHRPHRADDGTEHEDRSSSATCARWEAVSVADSGCRVRGHWGSKRLQLDAGHGAPRDDTPMCTQGSATLTLGVLRLLAYNLLQLARRKHLRPQAPSPAEAARKAVLARGPCAPSSKR